MGGGGSSRFFPGSQKADAIQWGGGGGGVADFLHSVGRGVVTQIFCYLQLRNHVFTQHRPIFVGRDTHFFWVRYANNKDFLLKKINHSNSPNPVRFCDISVRPGDQEGFLETHGNSVRLARSVGTVSG